MTSPPHQQTAATTPALRGPARSSHPPQVAAEMPSSTKNSVYVQPSVATFQSQVVVAAWAARSATNCTRNEPESVAFGHVTDWVMPSDFESGSQNTEKPYAIPMQRWIAKAAGG